jgi:DNA polymerase-3 subunit delta'
MNRNAASALLKILEEPPRRALLLLVAHSPGRLLPTIRSRCRRLMLGPLPLALVHRLVLSYRPGLDEGEAAALATLADGSIGRALELAEAGGVVLQRTLIALLAEAPRIDAAQLHAFADRMARADSELSYRLVGELVAQLLARLARTIVRGASDDDRSAGEGALLRRLAARGDAARWAHLRAEIEGNFERTDALNLDRKQAILGTFFAIAEAAG